MAIDFRIRDFFHPILIWRLKREFNENQWLPPEKLRLQQEERLRQIISRAYEAVPYYRRALDTAGLKPRDIQTLDDLPKLPLLSKAAAREAGTDLRALDSAHSRAIEYHTSGTTGTPLTLLHDKHANALEFVFFWRHWSWAGYRLGIPFAQLSTLFFMKPRMEGRIAAWQPHLQRLLLSTFQISKDTAGTMARELQQRGCQVIKGMASTVYHFALSMREAGVRPQPLRAVISMSEVLLPYQRAVIEEVFNCCVLDSYGHMERTVAVSQCEKGGRHVNSDYGILEFTNIRPSADGATLLADGVGTGLHNRIMPFIRYETGDSFELFTEPQACPCGRTFPLIKAIHGRQVDTVVTPDRRFLTTLFILPEFVTGLLETQFVQEAEDRLVIRVVPAAGFTQQEEEKLRAHAMTLVGSSMKVSVMRCASADLLRTPAGKLRSVIALKSST